MQFVMQEMCDEYFLAQYYTEGTSEREIVSKAKSLAVGQTLGTWTDVPGITDEMRERHLAKVVDILQCPPYDIRQENEQPCGWLITLAFPAENFADSVSCLLTALTGNDASTSARVKLVNITIPISSVNGYMFGGPKHGIQGVRKLTGIEGRPLVLNMIKPCTGIDPDTGAAIFYQTALGGVDIIKDDELMGNTSFSCIKDRVKKYVAASCRAAQITGKRVLYAVNITDRAERMIDNAKIAEDEGADFVMVNYALTGYSMMQAVSEAVTIPVIGHYAGSGMWTEGSISGMGADLANGKLPRLCGADIVIINTPYGNYPMSHSSYISTASMASAVIYNIKPSFPAVGGGVHPGMVERFVQDLGCDIVLASGGAVQGHPDGAAAGGKAMIDAAKAAYEGIDVWEAAMHSKELDMALNKWCKK